MDSKNYKFIRLLFCTDNEQKIQGILEQVVVVAGESQLNCRLRCIIQSFFKTLGYETSLHCAFRDTE